MWVPYSFSGVHFLGSKGGSLVGAQWSCHRWKRPGAANRLGPTSEEELWGSSWEGAGVVLKNDLKTGWWFEKICYFYPYLGKESKFDSYFSNGLKPPSRKSSGKFFRKEGKYERETLDFFWSLLISRTSLELTNIFPNCYLHLDLSERKALGWVSTGRQKLLPIVNEGEEQFLTSRRVFHYVPFLTRQYFTECRRMWFQYSTTEPSACLLPLQPFLWWF